MRTGHTRTWSAIALGGSALAAGVVFIALFLWGAGDGVSRTTIGAPATSPASASVPTYPAGLYKTSACAGLLIGAVEITFSPEGTVHASAVSPQDSTMKKSVELVWPAGFRVERGDEGWRLVRPDGSNVARDGTTLRNIDACAAFERRLHVLSFDP
jgi:hypothetical protein